MNLCKEKNNRKHIRRREVRPLSHHGHRHRHGQIGRMAVLAEYRNQGIGYKLLQFVLQHASRLNLEQVFLHAQVSAIPFYEKHGFTAVGNIFYEANIPHREMSLKIC